VTSGASDDAAAPLMTTGACLVTTALPNRASPAERHHQRSDIIRGDRPVVAAELGTAKLLHDACCSHVC
jgi:hypothetical protein